MKSIQDIMYTIGVDFGSDSVRALVVHTQTGEELAQSVCQYAKWKVGRYCNPSINQFRQHPQDYIDGLESTITSVLAEVGPEVVQQIVGIGIDTTGSTPAPVNAEGLPLALLPEFAENPNAMFFLWKDHTGIQEAEEINNLAHRWDIDYTQYEGGIYSSEWFWAKILQGLRADPSIREAAFSWVEHCDWIPFLLTGGKDVTKMKRSRCAAGHKALWHASWHGLPSDAFLNALDPLLKGLRDRMFSETYTSDVSAGNLSKVWAKRLGLSTEVTVAVGAFDAHMGAIGGEIEPYYLSKVMGTSTCDMLVAPKTGKEKLVRGICGQVDGSVVPGMLGLEAGQSAFGDVYAWFTKVISWPLMHVLNHSTLLSPEVKEQLIQETIDKIMPALSAAAQQVNPVESSVIALDWMNGRRTPDANQHLKGAIMGLNLGSDAPKIFRALVESTCFGARKIVDRFREEGVPIKGLIGLGGVAKKSPFIMQTMANVMGMPIKIAKSEQTCALGAAMFGATASGVFNNVNEAMKTMGSGFDTTYKPDIEMVRWYDQLYQKYLEFGKVVENITMQSK
jgi:L-ribulokinase